MSSLTSAIASRVAQNRAMYGAGLMLLVLYVAYNILHPRGFSVAVLTQNSNEWVALGFLAVAQTLPVLTAGLDLSVGAVMTLCNAIASELLNGSPLEIIAGMLATVLCGAAFGLANGVVVVYGRLQPIIATIASGAVAMGLALFIRPQPGGNVDGDLSWALTNTLFDFAETYGLFADGTAAWFQPVAWIPVPLIILFGVVGLVWLPLRRSVTGRTMYAVGSAEGAAFMSGLDVDRAKLVAYTLAGFFAGWGGLFLAIQTSSGNADITQAGAYTLNSIASVVIGGSSLAGGIGSAIGSLIGAGILRCISFYFRIVSLDPLLQPLVQGLVLLAAVSLGSLRILKQKNRLESLS